MGSVSGEDSDLSGFNRSTAHEEKILVSVRLRPLNEIEVSENDESDWECINNTIISKSSQQGMSSSAYNFDRVFGSDISTRQVYEEGAKNVALSALNGINASIFAYGQTSSGKTYTMSGITKYTLSDIFNYVDKHRSREFVLKFSALEIYNECVRDLLTSENTNLRLLDDPERGTVVERLTEFALRDWDQLKELLAFCETQRQIGETALNQMSSRSHQILRLTIESSTREYSTSHNSSSLTATVNFVDLAGSERVSQTLSEGTRLKEGCHINRSLLTLGTVIRKLSKGRNGHVPYRDSKLTRILQNSLGGNAKTAIICTLSPAHSHVEQSRNTLLFASCANQVTNRAQVNVVMSEKALVKLLQKELARLEKELRRLVSRTPGSCDSLSALREKERLIEKMDNEIRELTQQRDYAHSCLQNLQLAELSNLYNSSHEKGRAWLEDYPTSVSDINDPFRSEITSIASRFSDRYERIGSNKLDKFEKESYLSDDITPTKTAHKSDLITEDICKEVQCVEVEGDKCSFKSEQVPSQHEVNAIEVDNIETSQIEAQDLNNTSDLLDISVTSLSDINIPNGIGEGTPEMVVEANEENIDELNHDNDKLEDREDKTETSNEENIDQHNDYSTVFTEDYDLKDEKSEDTSKNTFFPSKDEQFECLQHDENFDGSIECQKQSVDNPVSGAFSSDDKNLECQKQILEDHVNNEEQSESNDVLQMEPISENQQKPSDNDSEVVANSQISSSTRFQDFERQRKEIIELWNVCNVPLVHRTYFFLLFNGEPSDSIYIEVEQRRLSYLKRSLCQSSEASSLRALQREREKLKRQMLKKYSSKERESLYENWGIDLKSKRRRLQLCCRLWTDTKDLEHIKESAALVSKLVGLVEPNHAPKEIFGLSLPSSTLCRANTWSGLPSLFGLT